MEGNHQGTVFLISLVTSHQDHYNTEAVEPTVVKPQLVVYLKHV